jgi:hypothetical protein
MQLLGKSWLGRKSQRTGPQVNHLLRTLSQHGVGLSLRFSRSAATGRANGCMAPLSHMLMNGFFLVQGFLMVLLQDRSGWPDEAAGHQRAMDTLSMKPSCSSSDTTRAVRETCADASCIRCAVGVNPLNKGNKRS